MSEIMSEMGKKRANDCYKECKGDCLVEGTIGLHLYCYYCKKVKNIKKIKKPSG